MKSVGRPIRRCVAAALPCGVTLMLFASAVDPAAAGACVFEAQGEGRVTEVIDARSFRLQDGREVRLAGIEPVATGAEKTEKTKRAAALAALVSGRDVTLHGADDTPDRYGRQPAFVFVAA